MIDEKYLVKINQRINKLNSKIKYSAIDKSNYKVSYLATKGTSFLGYKRGYFEQFQLQAKGLKESEKIRSNCKSYLEILRNDAGNIVQIKNITNGNVDCIHQSCYEGDVMYLFPFFENGSKYPT